MKTPCKWIRCLFIVLVLTLACRLWYRNKFPSTVRIKRTVMKDQTPRNGSCKLPLGDMHVCWLGAHMIAKDGEFYQALQRKANTDNIIILASVDSAFVDLAINYYETSFKKLKIYNFLFVCSDSLAVKTLAANEIDCFLYPQDTENGKPTMYGHKDFFRKQLVKVKMVAAALILGFTAVLSDIDMVFLQDPSPRFKIDVDMAFMSSFGKEVNGGLYIARPTPASIELHLQVLRLLMNRIGSHQEAINKVLRNMTTSKTLEYKELSKREFPIGKAYFEHANRTFIFDKPCLNGSCGVIAVHNNFIRTKAAKIYRFKENGMWSVDHNGYYSNPSRKYLQFSNPIAFGGETIEKEKSVLKTALTIGKLLNRTLILLSFHCCSRNECTLHCAFNHHFDVQSFDRYFESQYREHVFLEHPLVPASIKHSVSKKIHIASSAIGERSSTSANMISFNATDYNKGWVSVTDITKWFGKGNLAYFSVLHFQSLYISVKYEDKAWQSILRKAIIP